MTEEFLPEWQKQEDDREPFDHVSKHEAPKWPLKIKPSNAELVKEIWTTDDIIMGYPDNNCPKLYVRFYYTRKMFDNAGWRKGAV